MKSIKLSPGQLEKLHKAQHAEGATASQLQLATSNARVASQQRQDILDLILESAGVNPKSVPVGSQITLRGNILELPIVTEKKSQEIKKAIKKTPVK